MENQHIYTPPTSDLKVASNEIVLSSVLRRLAAWFLDVVALFIVSAVILILVAIVSPVSIQVEGVLAQIAFLAIFLLINGYNLVHQGQTIGKSLVGIRIVDLDNNVPDLFHVIVLRLVLFSLIVAVPVVGPILGLVDILFIFGPQRRCLHDYLAKTKVILDNDAFIDQEHSPIQLTVNKSIIADEKINSSGISYADYTKDDLIESLNSINYQQYPERAALIKLALERFQ